MLCISLLRYSEKSHQKTTHNELAKIQIMNNSGKIC